MIPINIEQHSFTSQGDKKDLWELTHLTLDNLEEIQEHMTLSPVALSKDLRRLQRELKKLLFTLDRPMAS